MTLTTHAIVGSAIASLMPTYPLLGICMAFASHFPLDALPHWDYPIRSRSVNPQTAEPMKYDRALLADMVTIGGDAVLGIVLAFVLFTNPDRFYLVLLGAGAGILPDALQFAYIRFPREPLASLQRFHQWVHSTYKMRGPLPGMLWQLAFVVAFVLIVRSLLS